MKWGHKCALTTTQMCSLFNFSVPKSNSLHSFFPHCVAVFLSLLLCLKESSLFQVIALIWLGLLGRKRWGRVGLCLGEEDASDLHAALSSLHLSQSQAGIPVLYPLSKSCLAYWDMGLLSRDWSFVSSYKVPLQLLGVNPRPLLHTSPLNISKSSLLLAKPQAYPSSQALHQCCNAASMLALGRMQGHLLSGCFLSTLLHHLRFCFRRRGRDKGFLHLTSSLSDSFAFTMTKGPCFPLLPMSYLLPMGRTGRWDPGSKVSSPIRKDPKV